MIVTRRSPRYQITGSDNECVVTHSTGETRHYWAPADGGYIYDVTHSPGTTGQQVCDGMGSLGETLRWSGRGDLANLIRAEVRAYYRAEDREMAAY